MHSFSTIVFTTCLSPNSQAFLSHTNDHGDLSSEPYHLRTHLPCYPDLPAPVLSPTSPHSRLCPKTGSQRRRCKKHQIITDLFSLQYPAPYREDDPEEKSKQPLSVTIPEHTSVAQSFSDNSWVPAMPNDWEIHTDLHVISNWPINPRKLAHNKLFLNEFV